MDVAIPASYKLDCVDPQHRHAAELGVWKSAALRTAAVSQIRYIRLRKCDIRFAFLYRKHIEDRSYRGLRRRLDAWNGSAINARERLAERIKRSTSAAGEDRYRSGCRRRWPACHAHTDRRNRGYNFP